MSVVIVPFILVPFVIVPVVIMDSFLLDSEYQEYTKSFYRSQILINPFSESLRVENMRACGFATTEVGRDLTMAAPS